jgi:hypothetical protein
MDIETITRYIARATVRTVVFVRDDDRALVDPTSIFITWTDPNDLKVVDQENIISSGRLSQGIYEHYYRTTINSPKGYWRGLAEIIDGSGPTAVNTPMSFSVEVA